MSRKNKHIFGMFFTLFIITFLIGCSPSDRNNENKNVELSKVHEQVKQELGEDYLPSREMDLGEIEELTNIDEADVKEYIAEAPLMSTHVDTFIAVEAKDGKGDSIAEGLEKYRTYLVDQSMQYPMNLAKVEAAKVVQHGDYVFFLMVGKIDDSFDGDSKEALDFATAEVERVEKVINSFFE
ncbi:DUF4358 domain-containing protein [Jeotgalibaca sp. MA1X17-3]|uniref:DUF4358 domain-containing protein n=1 Tax=Jeotgalibaca sp. MA1X17-3 TaxID=2908211 RepID=UPI001F434025|nr:DUF4358 domain-containing protein [Jeotgalibaca sp. MA1X17-3]UJF15402.1 DUF4358 domain-containing protein [Jeotgalibaca sp. MA1X17-3]